VGVRQERASSQETWTPRTILGKMVQEGKVISIDEVFTQGLKIMEHQIVEALLPNLQHEVLEIGFVQKQTDAGEKSRFKAVVVVGNGEGYVGIGDGKAKQVRIAIDKATTQAKLNIIPIRRGCGSWECACNHPHSLPFRVRGKCGSVIVEVIPGPRGLGLVAGEIPKVVLRLAGVKDCWTRSFGSTSTASSTAYAVYDALRSTYRIVTPGDWVR